MRTEVPPTGNKIYFAGKKINLHQINRNQKHSIVLPAESFKSFKPCFCYSSITLPTKCFLQFPQGELRPWSQQLFLKLIVHQNPFNLNKTYDIIEEDNAVRKRKPGDAIVLGALDISCKLSKKFHLNKLHHLLETYQINQRETMSIHDSNSALHPQCIQIVSANKTMPNELVVIESNNNIKLRWNASSFVLEMGYLSYHIISSFHDMNNWLQVCHNICNSSSNVHSPKSESDKKMRGGGGPPHLIPHGAERRRVAVPVGGGGGGRVELAGDGQRRGVPGGLPHPVPIRRRLLRRGRRRRGLLHQRGQISRLLQISGERGEMRSIDRSIQIAFLRFGEEERRGGICARSYYRALQSWLPLSLSPDRCFRKFPGSYYWGKWSTTARC